MRGCAARGEPSDGDDEPRDLSGSLERLARSLGASSAGSVQAVFSRWEEVVGPSVASHARPLSIRRGTLVVTVDHPGWATQVRYLEGSILDRLQETVGSSEISSIEVRVSPSIRQSDTRSWYHD